MTKTAEIEKLLSRLPDEVMPQLTESLNTLGRWASRNTGTCKSPKDANPRGFGMIPAKLAAVRRLLAEDLCDLG